ncbi:MAG: heat-inducible transcriptional repressor HrcA [Coprococcus sp.]
MELDQRKIKILNAIIQTYLETGEPVGSRTISRFTDLKLSSATIRNEMSDLEEMGYILQPHTSAGRIPSDKGYRFYVDNLMKAKTEEVVRQNEMMVQKVDKLEQVLKQVVKLLAVNTNYASLITAPQSRKNKLKFIQLSQVSDDQLLAVMMLEGNIIKNRILTVDELVEKEEVVKLNLLLNTYLQGLSLQEINMELIQTMKRQAQGHRNIISELIDTIVEAIQEEDDTEIYTSGTTNLLKYPELGDREKAGQLLYALEEKQGLNELIAAGEGSEEKHGIQVYIGSESPVQSMKDCSIVTATYELEEGVQGTIGIIGPKRMDYKKVVDNLETVMTQLDAIFKKDKYDNQNE